MQKASWDILCNERTLVNKKTGIAYLDGRRYRVEPLTDQEFQAVVDRIEKSLQINKYEKKSIWKELLRWFESSIIWFAVFVGLLLLFSGCSIQARERGVIIAGELLKYPYCDPCHSCDGRRDR